MWERVKLESTRWLFSHLAILLKDTKHLSIECSASMYSKAIPSRSSALILPQTRWLMVYSSKLLQLKVYTARTFPIANSSKSAHSAVVIWEMQYWLSNSMLQVGQLITSDKAPKRSQRLHLQRRDGKSSEVSRVPQDLVTLALKEKWRQKVRSQRVRLRKKNTEFMGKMSSSSCSTR